MAASSVAGTANQESRSSLPGDGALLDLRVVALGGGTGLPTVLRGLRAGLFESHPWDLERDQTRLTAIATVADDG
ncbi:MAG TPA: 2-phospho-L-lactate transferase CofD family protein, partial [Vicinamibacterales bacterium]|nr:2-phospho-L-lactate transferase CofD family protein [Vicinamibacterales bacterium]